MCGVDEFQPRRNNRVLRIADIANQNNEDASIEIRYDEGFNANNLLEEMERSRDEEGHVTLDYFDCVLPTSSYYYGALSLIIDNWDPDVFDVHSYRNIIDSFAKTIELACLSINQYTDEQWARLSDYVWEASKVLKTIVNLYFDEDFDKLDDYIDEVHDFFDEVVFEDLRALYQNNLSDVLEVLSILYNKCVALAYPVYEKCRCTENCFFSLSGAKDDYTGTCYANQGWSATGLANNYVLVNTLINHFFGFNFTDCHLVDNCRRYVKLASRSYDDNTFDGALMSRTANFATDCRKIRGTGYNIGRYYSCCEKKIVTSLFRCSYNRDYNRLHGCNITNELSSYIFLTKYMPCKMCRPALVGCYHIVYFNEDAWERSYDNMVWYLYHLGNIAPWVQEHINYYICDSNVDPTEPLVCRPVR